VSERRRVGAGEDRGLIDRRPEAVRRGSLDGPGLIRGDNRLELAALAPGCLLPRSYQGDPNRRLGDALARQGARRQQFRREYSSGRPRAEVRDSGTYTGWAFKWTAPLPSLRWPAGRDDFDRRPLGERGSQAPGPGSHPGSWPAVATLHPGFHNKQGSCPPGGGRWSPTDPPDGRRPGRWCP